MSCGHLQTFIDIPVLVCFSLLHFVILCTRLTSRDDAATRKKSAATTKTLSLIVLQYATVSERVSKSAKVISNACKYLLLRVHHDVCIMYHEIS